jgi:hypothetical protein
LHREIAGNDDLASLPNIARIATQSRVQTKRKKPALNKVVLPSAQTDEIFSINPDSRPNGRADIPRQLLKRSAASKNMTHLLSWSRAHETSPHTSNLRAVNKFKNLTAEKIVLHADDHFFGFPLAMADIMIGYRKVRASYLKTESLAKSEALGAANGLMFAVPNWRMTEPVSQRAKCENISIDSDQVI